MKSIVAVVALIMLIGVFNPISAQKLKNHSDSLAYSVGYDLGQGVKTKGFENLNQKMLMMAVKDALEGKEPKIDKKTAKSMVNDETRAIKERKHEGRKNEGIAFLKENAKRPEVKKLTNGIQYEVLKPGIGPKPEKGGDVKIHYEGKLLDGTVFDSSYERGAPATFNLKRLIKGWQIALPEMQVGAKWRLYIPYEMAYGERGAGGSIKPYSTLIFDIELLGI